MSVYLNTLTISILTFLFTTTVITAPIVLYQYRKNGFFQLKKAFDIYTFVFYLQTVVLLVLLPLPALPQKLDPNFNIWNHINLVPFSFINDIIANAKPLSLKGIISSSDFYTTVFNIFMLIPLGVYLKELMGFSLKKTIFVGFLFSLFCEVTQLTGIYFIYKQPYRYFDVNDLMTNTLGTAIGYFLAPLLSFLFVNQSQEYLKRLKISGEKVNMIPQYLILWFDFLIYGFLIGFLDTIIRFTIAFATRNNLTDNQTLDFYTGMFSTGMRIILFVLLFLVMPYVSPLHQTLSMKILKYSATVNCSKKMVPIRFLILYLCFAINFLKILLNIYYIVLILFRKKTTILDQYVQFEYHKML